ncbi:MAG: hypothetical protein MJZ61_08825, partial [Bacteroidales bacterium]|nr:hypothetical protein [Bacteroidales bacterium]
MKLLLYILLACIPFTAMSQNIPIPEIVSVKVDRSTGFPLLEWKISNTSLVDGYIIKRMIVDGDGVVAGTFNNVAVINDSQTFTYLDNSTSYSTSAQPLLRPEQYTVAAFKVIDGKTHYSLMSETASTLTVSGSYDPCTKKYSFTYSEPDGAVQYHLHTYSPADSKLSVSVVNRMDYTFPDFVPTRTFAI